MIVSLRADNCIVKGYFFVLKTKEETSNNKVSN